MIDVSKSFDSHFITQNNLENLPKPSFGKECDGWSWAIGCRCWACVTCYRRVSHPTVKVMGRIKFLRALVRLLQIRRKKEDSKMQPINDKVVIQRKKVEIGDIKSPGGIIVPTTTTEKPNEGEVLAAGPGRVLDSGSRAPMTVAVGDKVLFSGYAGTPVKVDNEEYVVMSESDILLVL